jgi:hypothetical protein
MATKWLELHKDAYEASTQYMDANHRADWEYGIRAFRNEHATGSKYLAPEYAARSRLFRPKTRSVIRKNEAAGAVALFSNMDIVDLQPGDPDNKMSVASRDAMKALLEYRLSKTIPTFEIAMGGIQDAQTTGAVVSYQYWEYDKKRGKDKPCIELRPIENIRLDGGASWIDPVNSSPYFFDIIPMYVCDVRAMMENKDDKTGRPKWKKFDDEVILRARPDVMDSTRKARLGGKEDPHDESTGIKSFDIVWVMRCFMRDSQGDDFHYYSLGAEELLTDPVPIEQAYFHGMRPYEMGYAILETHKAIKTSMPMLTKHLQQEANDVANMRIDNVKFVLNKRWIVARGRQVDVQSLVRNVPGGVTLATDPKNDVQESNWPDVTSSAYVEQDRINSDFDEIAGNFSPSTKVANNAVNDTLGGSKMAAMGAGLMTDYLLRTIIETWWEKVLRQLVKLEAKYETDEKVLALCAKKARLFPRYGLSAITDEMLEDEVSLTVNVGMGSSNPNERFQKLIAGFSQVMDVIAKAPPSFNAAEFVKEASSNMGFRDGTRFWSDDQDPRVAKLMQMVQQLQQALQGKQMDLQAQASIEQMKIQGAQQTKAAELDVDRARIAGDLQIRQAELAVEERKLELEQWKIRAELLAANEENKAKLAETTAKVRESEIKLEEAQLKLEAQRQKLAADAANFQMDMEAGQMKLQGEREKFAAEKSKQDSDKAGQQAAVDLKQAAAELLRAAQDAKSKQKKKGAKIRIDGEEFNVEFMH